MTAELLGSIDARSVSVRTFYVASRASADLHRRSSSPTLQCRGGMSCAASKTSLLRGSWSLLPFDEVLPAIAAPALMPVSAQMRRCASAESTAH
jgi:hypothetical protein